MQNLEEKSDIKETKLRGVETIVGIAENCLKILPRVMLTAMGIGLATYGAVKKESSLVCVGAAMTVAGAGFTGAYINSARKMLKRDYESDDEIKKRD